MRSRKLCLAGYALVAVASIGCSRGKGLNVAAPSVVQSAPGVQQQVAAAWDADRSGDSDRALAMYLDVLASDPDNAWAKRRVEQLSKDMPMSSTQQIAQAVKQSAEETERAAEAVEAPTEVDASVQTVAATDAAQPGQPENPFKDWFTKSEESTTSPVDESIAQATATPVVEETTSVEERFPWATQNVAAAPEPQAETSVVAATEAAPQDPVDTTERHPFDDEAVFEALDGRTNPFLAQAAEEQKAKRDYPWDHREQAGTIETASVNAFEQQTQNVGPEIKPVGFSKPEPAIVDEAPVEPKRLVDLCRDANVQVLGLVHQLESPLPADRRTALSNLGLMGRQAQTARLPVRLMFDDAVPVVAAEAAWTLWQIEKDAFDSVRKLSSLIDSSDAEASQMAIQSLGLIGPDAVTAAPLLRDRLNKSTGVKRVRIAESLIRIQPEDVGALQVIVEATRYGRPQERAEATYALSHTPGELIKQVTPVLINALHDKEEPVRTAAALTLGSFGPAAEDARLALEAASRFDTRPVRDAARATLACLPE